VKKTATRVYAYVLEGKAKTAADADYVAVLTGNHTQAADAAGNASDDFGHGSFRLDFSAAKSLPENDGNSGAIAFTYSRAAENAVATVDVSIEGFHAKQDPATKLSEAQYHYDATPGAGGEFRFHTLANLDSDATRPALEDLTIESRWLATGAGRSDLNAEGGDLSAKATVSECWDTNFVSRFLSVSFDPTKDYGSAATDCATFITAKFPQG